jgi:CBS domain-containing protein
MRICDMNPRGAITVERGETLRGASKRLADDDIGALIVFNTNGLAGIFSERDLARAVADGADLDEEQVEDFMTESPVTVDHYCAIGAAISYMNEHAVRHLVVVDEGDVVGMISIRDLVALFGTAWPEL